MLEAKVRRQALVVSCRVLRVLAVLRDTQYEIRNTRTERLPIFHAAAPGFLSTVPFIDSKATDGCV